MPKWLAGADIVDGPVPLAVWGLTILGILILLARPPRAAWIARCLFGLFAGAAVGVGAVLVADAAGSFGERLPLTVTVWAGAGLGGAGLAIASLWGVTPWRRVVAVVVAILTVLSTVIGINASFGINRTLGALFGVSSLDQVDGLDGPHPSPRVSPSGPLYARWTPPADMPAQGKVGLLSGASAIPSSAGFTPRDASIYLPPAAQVPDAPALPLVVMMMGQPGNPDPSFIQTALDALAAQNKGLAPIVIVADQLGDPSQDPLCTDSSTYGGVATYINTDVVAYAKSRLNIIQDPAFWTIAGYSNGGACAFIWGTQHPDIWGNIISISGEPYAGSEDPNAAIAGVYGGDQAAFEANKPEAWIQKNAGAFAGHVAVFTAGENDPVYVAAAQASAQLAQNAGFTATSYIVPGAGHVQDALNGGLPKAFQTLYPRLGLSAP
ncbi:MAG: esterase [Microbacterium sp.]|uniref:alpha/beta hydrolase n=1 Tax=Microbacterium sp. TaxID=51671 RepID=UPI001AD46EE2|nr:PHB depolymerase family esterase [Microbacterium sp.]MBN9176723.1 esterase [Microbacterium sp.]